jgi:hypothetical protein
MNTNEMQILNQIQETQIVILSKLFDLERRASGNTRSPADYTQEAHDYIKTLREHLRLNQRTILRR